LEQDRPIEALRPKGVKNPAALSLGISLALLVLPGLLVLLILAVGLGASLYAGPESADAGGWIILIGIAILGTLGTLAFLAAGMIGIVQGVRALVRRRGSRLAAVLGIGLNAAGLLAFFALILLVAGQLLAYPRTP
jgi:hypothetical protein